MIIRINGTFKKLELRNDKDEDDYEMRASGEMRREWELYPFSHCSIKRFALHLAWGCREESSKEEEGPLCLI